MKIMVGIILAIGFIHLTVAQPSDSLVTVEQLVSMMEKNNPGLMAAYNKWQAREAVIPQAGALPDPTISFNLLNLPVSTLVFDQEAMTGKQIAFMQMIPFPGKLGLREGIAREGAAASQASYQEVRAQLIKKIKTLYYNLFYINKALETVRKNTEVLRQFVNIAQTKYAVGRGLQQDVLRAQVELSKMMDKEITLAQKKVALIADINFLLSRPPSAALGNPAELQFVPLNYQYGELKELADQNRPLLKAWQAAFRQSEKQIRLAKKEYLPDFKLGVAYTQRDVLKNGMGGADFITGLVTVDIPLYFWRKQRKKVEETRYLQSSIAQQYADVQNQLYSQIESTLSELKKNARLVDLYKTGIIPQATQSLNSAIAGYQTDKVDFLTMLNNEMTLFNYQLDYYRFLSDYYIQIAELEALVGVPLASENQ